MRNRSWWLVFVDLRSRREAIEIGRRLITGTRVNEITCNLDIVSEKLSAIGV